MNGKALNWFPSNLRGLPRPISDIVLFLWVGMPYRMDLPASISKICGFGIQISNPSSKNGSFSKILWGGRASSSSKNYRRSKRIWRYGINQCSDVFPHKRNDILHQISEIDQEETSLSFSFADKIRRQELKAEFQEIALKEEVSRRQGQTDRRRG